MAYKKCPRCEMNWIQDTEELCEVCKAELGIKSTITLLDDDYAEKALGAKLCPICGINYIDENEDMCESCRADKTSRAGSKHKDSSDAKQYISDYQDDNDYNPDDINADSDEDENEDELAEFEDENSGFSVIDREDLLNTDDTEPSINLGLDCGWEDPARESIPFLTSTRGNCPHLSRASF